MTIRKETLDRLIRRREEKDPGDDFWAFYAQTQRLVRAWSLLHASNEGSISSKSI